MATKQKIEETLTAVSGVSVEVTMSGKRSFTFSFDGKNEEAAKKIQRYFAPMALEYDYDEECDFTCLYMNI